MQFRRYLDYMTMSPLGAVQSFLVGLMVGSLVYAGTVLLSIYVMNPILCQGGGAGQYCGNAEQFSYVINVLAFNFVGLLVLIRIGIIRPLLVVVAVVIALWGSYQWIAGLPWWLAGMYASVITALAYVCFTWINRMSVFPVALGLTIAVVVALRLLLVA